MINSINPIPLALPYPGNGSFMPVDRESARFQVSVADGGATVGGKAAPRVDSVKSPRFTVNEQGRQQESGIDRQIFSGNNSSSDSRHLPRARILAELINRMGGSGIYSGPGRVLNIAV